VGCSERRKEIKRRRQRKSKMGKLTAKVAKASVSDKAVIAHKIRALTPGAESVIARLELEQR